MTDAGALWVNRARLQEVQYQTDANLAARQSIYAYQRPRTDLPRVVLGLAALRGSETVADIGCGNGIYLSGLAGRRHAGPAVGVDLSRGMLTAARQRAPAAALLAGDAVMLPLRDGASDVTLAMHMLYHVPDPASAVRELRRVTRPGGLVLVGLNGGDHLRELRDLIAAALPDAGRSAAPVADERLRLDQGQDLLATAFTSVIRHDFTAELLLPGPGPVERYVRSMIITQDLADPERLVTAVARRVRRDGTFRVRTHTGCLVCS